MLWPVVVAWIHYVSIMLMIASLLGEHLLLKQELTAAQAGTVQRLDGIYGGSAVMVLVTGFMRMYLEKGTTYYLHSGPFHALLGLFIVVALLSIYPTVAFLRWRGGIRAGRGQQLEPGQFKRLQMILRVEITLTLLAPFFATWMAHGSL
jgi:putative membrane protein